MKRRRKTIAAFVSILLMVLLIPLLITLNASGAFDELTPHDLPGIELISGLEGGSEDLVFRTNLRQVFASSADFNKFHEDGHLYLFDVTTRELRDVTPALEFPFLPHGIDLWRGDGVERLFVVNHRRNRGSDQPQHTVEIFDVAEDGSLEHTRTVSGDLLFSPNDVAAAGPNVFYVTNDHGYAGVMQVAEDYLRLPAGNVVVFDGTQFRIVYEGTRCANGIKVSPDGLSVYLAETTNPSVTWFGRNPITHELTIVSSMKDWPGVDNISIDAHGDLWIGAHPKLLQFVSHAKDHSQRSPSQILRVRPQRDAPWLVTEVYTNDGTPLSGSSVAATNGDVLIMGTVFEHSLLMAPVPERVTAN